MTVTGTETREDRLKRLYMRSCRRGIKEMDIVLGNFAEANLAKLSEEDLVLYDALLSESDQDMLRWLTDLDPVPEPFVELFSRITGHAYNK